MEQKTKLQESCLAFAKHLLAAGAVWKDSTSYSRDTKEKIPTAFSTNVGECRISITCGHRDYRPADSALRHARVQYTRFFLLPIHRE